MNAEIRRILCATDLAGNCDHIYNYAMNLACESDASLMVIHVISQRSIKAAKRLAYFFNETRKNIVREKTYAALKRMQEQLSALFNKEFKDHPEYPDLIEHLLVYPGNIADIIVEKANYFGCNTIVLGSHSTSFLGRYFSFGTTKNILRRTKKPVFLVSMKKGKLIVTNCNLN